MVVHGAMPQPVELCLEDVAADEMTDRARYLRCVALTGRQPGLGIDRAGNVTWRAADGLASEIWVSGDDRLILLRPAGAPPVRLSRARRSLELPEGKPVVVLGGDLIEVGPRCLRVHVHGVAPSVHEPTPLTDRLLGHAAKAAAIMAMSAAVAGCDKPIQVRDQVPSIPEPPPTQTMATGSLPPGTPPPPPSGSAPIEGRDNPPGFPGAPPTLPGRPPGTPPGAPPGTPPPGTPPGG